MRTVLHAPLRSHWRPLGPIQWDVLGFLVLFFVGPTFVWTLILKHPAQVLPVIGGCAAALLFAGALESLERRA